MCIKQTYIHLPRGNSYVQQPVPCGRCWACLKNRTNDLVGRCLLEASTSKWVHTLTLTYDDKRIESPLQTTQIQKVDFQRFMKRLRKHTLARCLVAGEYGSRKGRTHFHCILFGYGPEPEANHYEEYQYYPHWDWGYTYSENTISPNSVRYIAKYLTKKRRKKLDDSVSLEWVSYSKVPLLGGFYFHQLGEEHGLRNYVPYTLNYQPPGYNGNDRFSMYGVAQTVYFDALTSVWPEFESQPKTEWVENAFKRYKKRVHLEAWNALSPQEQSQYLDGQIRHRFTPPLTRAQIMRQRWEDYDRKAAYHVSNK